MITIYNSLSIPGWMEKSELEWLARQAETHRSIVEIGCWQGRSTVTLAENTKGRVLAVDHWEGSPEVLYKLEGKPKSWLLDQFKVNVSHLANVDILQMPSVKAAKEFHETRFDMIFIDGSHEYWDVKEDILAWAPLLEPGGLLCGHDFVTSEGVTRAVRELLSEAKPAEGTFSIWEV